MTRPAPTGLLRFALRSPLWLHRVGLRRLLARRVLLLVHAGRRTGRRHETALAILRHDVRTGTYFVCSAWGTQSHWFRNIQRNPDVMVTIGTITEPALAAMLELPDSARELLRFARHHPTAFRLLARWLIGRPAGHSTDDLLALATSTPVVAIRSLHAGHRDRIRGGH